MDGRLQLIDIACFEIHVPRKCQTQAKARANASDFLPGSFTKGNVLLHRRGQRTGQLGLLVNQGIVSGGHGICLASSG